MNFIPLAFFEQRYMISEEGKIKNLANNSLLQPSINPNGYLKVGLANGDGSHKQELVHILVARHFLPNPYGLSMVNHLNGVKTNCHKDNLEWCTAKRNVEHALQTGLRPGYMSADEKELHLAWVLQGHQVSDIASRIGRRPETLHKMLRETAERLGIKDQWDMQMKGNRRAAAIRNLGQINN